MRSYDLLAQKSDSIPSRVTLSGFPVAYYTPETGLDGGLFGLMNFNWKSDTLNATRSSITLGSAITVLNQFLLYLPFNLFLKNDGYRLNGELGYYRYTYFFFGIGNDSGNFEDKKESFRVTFPRFRLSAMKKVQDHLFLGFRYAFDSYTDLRLEENSNLEKNQPTGIDLGINSGVGPALLYDSRSSIFYPRNGFLLDITNTNDFGRIVSNYSFSRLTVDGAYFYSPFKKSVVGFNVFYQQNTGNVPFYQMSLLGGGKRLRGWFEGEFRDNYAWQSQLEWRQEFWKNWGATAFFGFGSVAPTWEEWSLKNQKVGYGVGVRYKLNKKDHVNIRLDLGFGGGNIYPYLTIGEAF